MDWTVRVLNPGVEKTSTNFRTGSRAHTASHSVGTAQLKRDGAR